MSPTDKRDYIICCITMLVIFLLFLMFAENIASAFLWFSFTILGFLGFTFVWAILDAVYNTLTGRKLVKGKKEK